MEIKDFSAQIDQIAQSYQYPQSPQLLLGMQELLTRMWRMLGELLSLLKIQLPGSADSRLASSLLQALWYMAACVALFVTVYLLSRHWQKWQKQQLKPSGLKSSSLAPLSALAWRHQAEQLSAQGQHREACRALYLSLLRLLHEREIAPFAPHKTNYEYAFILSNHPQLQKDFKEMVLQIEDIWFGDKAADQEDYQSLCTLLTSIERGSQLWRAGDS